MRPRPRSHRRRGTTLVYFATMAFALFGLAALVIDLGLALVTRRQMQTAVDAAAVEGLRFRDEIPPSWLADDATRAAIEADCGSNPSPDCVRRWAASRRVALIFDDDLDPETDEGDLQLGAGPVVALEPSEAHPELEDLRGIAGLGVYKPRRSDGTPGLERNDANAPHGDLVPGTYLGGDDHAEGPAYGRADFQAGSGNAAFLVRMRRTNDFEGLDNEPGVSSSGPSLPFLFGRGSMMSRDPDSSYDPRQHGITVRATAIADARPVMSVGRPLEPVAADVFPGAAGVTPFALRLAFWSDERRLPRDTPTPLEADPSGRLTANPPASNGLPDGQFLAWPASPQPRLPSIGWRVSSLQVAAPEWPSSPALVRYVPLYDVVAGEEWVVGFGRVEVVNTVPLRITKRRGIIAAENASGGLIDGTENGTDPAGVAAVIAANQALRQAAPDLILLAPAPVR